MSTHNFKMSAYIVSRRGHRFRCITIDMRKVAMTPHHIEARFIDFTINIAAPLILFGAIGAGVLSNYRVQAVERKVVAT